MEFWLGVPMIFDLAPEKRLPMLMMYNHGHWSHFDEKTENGCLSYR